MVTLSLYYYASCSKSRFALAWLNDRGFNVDVRDYVNHGLDDDELLCLTKALGMHPREFVRSNAPEIEHLGADDFSVEEWLAIIVANPLLLQRPIAVYRDHAAIVRSESSLQAFVAKCVM
jgi:arsenate reductase (glutaredoxin)